MTREEAIRLVKEFREKLQEIYGDRLNGVYLYGSYARDEATEDSDIDVAVVLEGPVNRHEESKRVSVLVAELSLRENCVLMPFHVSEEELQKRPFAIHRSIAREAVPV